jgi:PRTRC genetic system protein A
MLDLGLTQYHIALPGVPLPPVDETKMLDYAVGANGVYVRGRRTGLEVCMPASFNLVLLRGLSEVSSYVKWEFPKVPLKLVEGMLHESQSVCASTPTEALFYLSYGCVAYAGEKLALENNWYCVMPEQIATDDSVVPTEAALNAGAGTDVIVELHSHHSMRPVFSPDDNADESQGFRVYSVIGTIFDKPTIRTRVGLWGHFWDYPSSEFYELPDQLTDCVKG